MDDKDYVHSGSSNSGTDDSRDEDYDAEKERDKGDGDDIDNTITENDEHNGKKKTPLKGKENGRNKSKVMKKGGSQNSKGRGPTKGINVKEKMHLEYNEMGQPCGKWRGKYGSQIGLCMRKLSILWAWNDVPEGVKQTLWDDTMNLFHIQPNEWKKEMFFSALSQRFRDFKSKLVSGWITRTRDRSRGKKRKHDNEGEVNEGEKSTEEGRDNRDANKKTPEKMPYEIWDHISKDDWDAFVTKKKEDKELERSSKASASAKKKKYHHHMGPKTYEEKRKEWISEGFYPNSCASSSTGASSSQVTGVKVDRVSDWYCSLHSRDERGKRTISEPSVKELADAVIGWKKKEIAGEFSPKGDKDALYMVLGKDHKGRVKGTGGVRVGLKKAFGKEYSASRSSVTTPQDLDAIKEELRKELREEMAAMFENMGYQRTEAGLQGNVGDKSSHRDPSTPIDQALNNPPADQFILEIKEEMSCELLLPELGVGSKLVTVAYGRAQPPTEGQKVHLAEVKDDAISVSVDTIISGFEDAALPIPRPDWDLHTLTDAQGSFITWPCSWVKISNKVVKEKNRIKAKKVDANEKGLKANKEKNKANGEEVDSQAEGNKGIENVETRHLSSKGSCPQVKSKVTPLVNASVLKSLTQACFLLHGYVSNLPEDNPIQITLNKLQFNYSEDTQTWVSKGDITEFLTGAMLNVSVLQAFMSKLFDDLVQRKSAAKIGWLCPQEISASHFMQNPLEVKHYIEEGFNEANKAGHNFIIAPYLQSMHWLLLVLAPSTNTVYQFDSLRQEPPRELIIKTSINGVMKKMSGRRGLSRTSLPEWKSVKCAQQKNGLECGYYVMRFMHDIVSTCTEVNDLEKVYKVSRETNFSVEEIAVVRDLFADFVSECICSL